MHIEGKYTVTPGAGGAPPTYNYSENTPPNNKSGDSGTLVGNIITQAGGLNIPAANFDANTQTRLALMFNPAGTDPNGQITNVSTDPVTIRHALTLDGPYPDNSPCPSLSVEQRVAAAVSAALPGPIGS
jgi:hypothetical protein